MRRILYAAIALSCICSCAKHETPLIGISTSYSETGRMSVGQTYVNSVIQAGGVPVLIPLVRDSITAEKIISRLDGIIMTGGEDFAPAYFHEEEIPELGTVNGPRDTSDMLLMNAAIRHRLAILGICRGEQGLNVALGGSLYQDLPAQHPSAAAADSSSKLLTHRQEEPSTTATQTVTIAEGSYLHQILGVTELQVNSHHHQAVKDPAPGITVTATSSDGVVEAIEALQYGIVATQFHPEAFAQYGKEPYIRIFQDLVKRSGK